MITESGPWRTRCEDEVCTEARTVCSANSAAPLPGSRWPRSQAKCRSLSIKSRLKAPFAHCPEAPGQPNRSKPALRRKLSGHPSSSASSRAGPNAASVKARASALPRRMPSCSESRAIFHSVIGQISEDPPLMMLPLFSPVRREFVRVAACVLSAPGAGRRTSATRPVTSVDEAQHHAGLGTADNRRLAGKPNIGP